MSDSGRELVLTVDSTSLLLDVEETSKVAAEFFLSMSNGIAGLFSTKLGSACSGLATVARLFFSEPEEALLSKEILDREIEQGTTEEDIIGEIALDASGMLGVTIVLTMRLGAGVHIAGAMVALASTFTAPLSAIEDQLMLCSASFI